MRYFDIGGRKKRGIVQTGNDLKFRNFNFQLSDVAPFGINHGHNGIDAGVFSNLQVDPSVRAR